MGRRKGRCVYSGFAGGLTDEHVLPTWIAWLLPEGGCFETFTTGADGKPVRHFESVEQLGLVAHVVCGPWNHCWMERLETRVLYEHQRAGFGAWERKRITAAFVSPRAARKSIAARGARANLSGDAAS